MLLAQAWSLIAAPLASILLLAQEEETKSYNAAWGIVMLCVVLGMLLTLKVSKREPIEDKPLDV